MTATAFVYTGGEECGVAIGLVNYPRFPASESDLWGKARALAAELLPALNQRTCLIVGQVQTEWLCVEPPGARAALGVVKQEESDER